MSYENFRTDVLAQLVESFSSSELAKISNVLDSVSSDYEFSRKSKDLIVVEDLPQIVRLYVTSKTIENRSKATLDMYLRTLKMFFHTVGKPFDKVTSNDIRVYLFKYKETRAVNDSTIEGIRLIINGFYTWCVNEEYMQRNPAAKIASIKHDSPDRKPMSTLELERFRRACKTLREKAVVDFLFSTGCRVSELTNVSTEDVDFQNCTVFIRKGKGGKHRTTYLNAEALVSLQEYLKSRSDESAYLFVSDRNPHNKLTTKAVQDIVRKIEGRAGIKTHVTPHVLRHTAATYALRSGMPVEQVQRFLGHSNINTTMIYTKVDDSEVKASHQKYVA